MFKNFIGEMASMKIKSCLCRRIGLFIIHAGMGGYDSLYEPSSHCKQN
jgi:hypothetical protein